MNKLSSESYWFLKREVDRKLEKEKPVVGQSLKRKKKKGSFIDFFYKMSRVELGAIISFILAKMFGLLSIIGLAIVMAHKSFVYIPIIAGSLWGFFIVLSITLCILYMRKHKELNEKELYEKLKRKYEVQNN